MTLRTNARVAGFAFLLYIALGITSMVLMGKATGVGGIAAKLASIAQLASYVHIAFVLNLLSTFCALVLGVTLYAITREEDPDLAMLGLSFRVGEGVIGAISIQRSLSLMWLATATGANAPDAQGAHALGAFLLRGQGGSIAAIFFAVGSTFFSWLLLRGRMIPVGLAWLGVLASVAAAIGLPLELVDVIPSSYTWFFWIPLAVFEIWLALLFIIKGVAMPARTQSVVAGPTLREEGPQ